MSEGTALATTPERALPVAPVVVVTHDQINVIKETICKDATQAEMELFFYDCRRRGVHPLDKLIHFTKRKGKYTPVTSIDYFRSRAAETREHMGTDDAVFVYYDEDATDLAAATVTVYRLVQGEKCPFTATARMLEYMPDAPNDFMWKKMPHGQLGKCAEALALRKAFPQELANLHTVEEMAQADDENGGRGGDERGKGVQPGQRKSQQNGSGQSSTSETKSADAGAAKSQTGKIKSVEDKKTGTGKTYYAVQLFTGFGCTTWSSTIAEEARKHQAAGQVIELVTEIKDPNYPPTLKSIKVATSDREPGQEG
jgi:phage recombination protein Bet